MPFLRRMARRRPGCPPLRSPVHQGHGESRHPHHRPEPARKVPWQPGKRHGPGHTAARGRVSSLFMALLLRRGPGDHRSSFINNKERANYAIALLSMIRPLQGITAGSQQNLVASTLGTAAAVTAGVAAGSVIADLVTGPDTITTTIESVRINASQSVPFARHSATRQRAPGRVPHPVLW